MSTIRTASIRGRGGSRPNSRGDSPLSTQRQNFFSAASRRCKWAEIAISADSLYQQPIEGLGHHAKLDDEIVGEVLRLGLAAFLVPQPQQGSLVAPHDHPGV